MNHFQMMLNAIDSSNNAAGIADYKDGLERDLWLADEARHRGVAMIHALASIAESLKKIAEREDDEDDDEISIAEAVRIAHDAKITVDN